MTLSKLDAWNIHLTRGVALLGLAALMVIASATLVDIVARWIFSAPIAGVYDLSRLFITVAMAACFPAALASRQNIRVTFLADMLPGAFDRLCELFASVVTLAFFTLLAWQLVGYSADLIRSGETTFILRMRVAPWWVVTTGLFLLCIPVQLLVVVIDALRLFGRGQPPSGGTQ